ARARLRILLAAIGRAVLGRPTCFRPLEAQRDRASGNCARAAGIVLAFARRARCDGRARVALVGEEPARARGRSRSTAAFHARGTGHDDARRGRWWRALVAAPRARAPGGSVAPAGSLRDRPR